MADVQLAVRNRSTHLIKSSQGPFLARCHTSRLAHLPTELRWQIYECLTIAANSELEYIRDHCKCGYDYTRCDEGEPKNWRDADCHCTGGPEAWLDSAFPDSTALQQDSLTLTNLFMASPELDPGIKLLDILCFRWDVYMARPLADHLHNTARLLHLAHCQGIIPEIAMELGALGADNMRALLNFLKAIGYCGLGLRFALRITWPTLFGPSTTDLKQYAELRKYLERIGHFLKTHGGWLKLYAIYHWCCGDDSYPLPAPCSEYDMKVISTVPFEHGCTECEERFQSMLNERST